MVQKKIRKEIKKTTDGMKSDLDKSVHKSTFQLPVNGLKYSRLEERMEDWKTRDRNCMQGDKQSGSIYLSEGEFKDNVKAFASKYLYMNMKDRGTFNSIRQMESELIQMTNDLLNGTADQTCGLVTQGGTESIFMAIYTYREQGRKNGITKPNIIICNSTHSAFDKACFYLDVELKRVPQDAAFKMDVNKTKRAIDKNTIMIVASAPNFSSGIVDDIEALSQLAHDNGAGMHVDCCLGGFVLCFAEKMKLEEREKDLLKQHRPVFDFRNPYVTSISIDHHKYGLAPKGLSCLMFNSLSLRRLAYYIEPQGKDLSQYNTGLCDNTNASALAGGWYSLMHTGQAKFTQITKSIMMTTQFLVNAINAIKGVQVLGEPYLNVVAITTTDSKVNVYSLQNALTTQGWELNALQNPPAFHIAITEANYKRACELPKLISQSIQKILENPQDFKGGSCALYGTTNQIPDATIVGDVMRNVQDIIISQ